MRYIIDNYTLILKDEYDRINPNWGEFIMNDLQLDLLELVEEEASIEQIQKELKISTKNLLYQLKLLKDKGYNIASNYYSDGTTRFFIKTELDSFHQKIFIPEKSNEFDFIVSSDNHLGSVKQDIDNTYAMYDYCKNNDRHIIINCGDFFSGAKPSWTNPTMALFAQFERAIKDYPYDQNILNFIILGNHDMAYVKLGLDLKTMFAKERHDLIPIGHNFSYIDVKNEVINVSHKPIRKEKFNKLVFFGHHHKYETMTFPGNNQEVYIQAPSLSNIPIVEEEAYPGFLDCHLTFKNGYFDMLQVKQLGFKDNKPIVVGGSRFTYIDDKPKQLYKK